MELERAVEDDLLPDELSLDHIWLDYTGRVCLLDRLLMPSSNKVIVANSKSKEQRCIGLLVELLENFVANQDHPISVGQLLSELKQRQDQPGTLDWFADELNEFSEKPTTWNVLDRIGMLAISLGLEFSPISAVMFTAGVLMLPMELDAPLMVLLLALSGMIVAVVYGLFFRGGPAMRLTGVELRRSKTGGPANKLQAAIRSIVAWLPWIFILALILYPVVHKLQEDPTVSNISLENSDLLGPALLISLIPLAIGLFGMLAAALNPPRGIPDWVVGTRLMRK